ncbi:MAG: ABC transporter substrate-binding protein [Lachnospiraceae bacterium]|nr:ABC transporter substrate-binding protein [Lachnospiraceae bacterium]
MKKMMKKALCLITGLALLTGMLTGCGSDKPTLKVYSWGEYIDTSLLRDFEKEYNCKVIYETFDSNESMYTKIQSGERYDVLVPSDYMIERLIKEDGLQAIDWSLIPNADGLDEAVMGEEFDPDNTYSVPFFYGTVGILYDTTVVDEADLEDGWEILRNEKYAGDIYMYDSERDSFMIALKALGYSMNTTNKDEIDEAYQWLIEQRDTMNPVYAGDDVIDNMISGNKAMAVVYSGDAAYIMSENEDLEYYEPEEGTNIWQDAMVITSDCTEVELAHAYINFMLDAEHAYANTVAVGYTSPVVEARTKAAEEDFAGNSAYLPDVEGENDEVFRYQEQEIKEYFAELWTKVKAAN